MAFRLYRVPVIIGAKSARLPKYFDDGTRPSLKLILWAVKDYGFEPIMLVGADCSGADDTFLVAQSDVVAFPFDLTPTLSGGQVTAVQAQLEAANLPGGWVTTSLTWRQVARTILGIFDYLGAYAAVYTTTNGSNPPSLYAGGVTLNTTFGALPAAVQAAMIGAANQLNISTAGLTSGITLRVILKALADNFQGKTYLFNGNQV